MNLRTRADHKKTPPPWGKWWCEVASARPVEDDGGKSTQTHKQPWLAERHRARTLTPGICPRSHDADVQRKILSLFQGAVYRSVLPPTTCPSGLLCTIKCSNEPQRRSLIPMKVPTKIFPNAANKGDTAGLTGVAIIRLHFARGEDRHQPRYIDLRPNCPESSQPTKQGLAARVEGRTSPPLRRQHLTCDSKCLTGGGSSWFWSFDRNSCPGEASGSRAVHKHSKRLIKG